MQIGGAGVGRHDDDDIAEVGLAPVVVGQRTVIHDLQQDVEDVRMRLFDFVEQQHAVRFLGNCFGQQAALVEADITWRGADQPRNGMALHIFAHVEARQLDSQGIGELLGDFGLADAGWATEQEGANRLVRIAEARTRHLDRPGQRVDRLVLAENDSLQIAIEILQCAAVVGRDMLRRNTRDLGDDLLNVGFVDDFFLLRFRQDSLRCTSLVDDVDCLVRQVAVGDIAGGQFGGRTDRGGRIFDAVVRFETGF